MFLFKTLKIRQGSLMAFILLAQSDRPNNLQRLQSDSQTVRQSDSQTVRQSQHKDCEKNTAITVRNITQDKSYQIQKECIFTILVSSTLNLCRKHLTFQENHKIFKINITYV